MGDINQKYFLQNTLKNFSGRVLEVGSKDYGNTIDFRSILNADEYIGVDLESGKNVDQVVNFEDGIGELQGSFDLVILCSILEHSKKPWLIAANVQRVLSPNGLIFLAHPWVWRYHKYPDDYYRFSPSGIKALFDEISFWLDPLYSTNKPGDFYSFAKNESVDNHLSILTEQGVKYLPYLQTLMMGCKSPDIFEQLKKDNPEL